MNRLFVTICMLLSLASLAYGQGGLPISHGVDRTAIGTITGTTQTVILPVNGMGSTSITLTGTFVATCQVKFIGPDNTTLSGAISVYPAYSEAPTPTTSLTTTGTWDVDNVAGKNSVEVVCTAYTSGTVSVAMQANEAPGILKVNVIAGSGGGGGGGGVVTQSDQTQLLGTMYQGGTWTGVGVTGTFWPYTLGQQIAANSVPVILPSATVTTLTPPAAITGFALEAGHAATIDTSTASTATNTSHLTDNTQTTRITDGTTTANIAPATGAQTGQAGLQVANTYQTQSFSFGSAVAGTTLDVSSYKSVSVQITTNASGNTVVFQGSNDNTNWDSITLTQTSNNLNPTVQYLATAVPRIFAGACPTRYFRVNCTNFIGGTTTGTVYLSTLPSAGPPGSMNAGQTGTWTVTGNLKPLTSGGNTPFWADNLAGTVTSVKSSAGQLYNIQIDNTQAATACYVQIFNTATGSVTLGTTSPVLEYYVPGSSNRNVSFGDIGDAFGTAISIASTTTDKGATGSASGVIVSGSFN